jgi:hypothetical protein
MFGSHALCSTVLVLYTMRKVLQNHVWDGRNGIENRTYPIQFFGSGVLDIARHQWHLFLILFAHFGVAPFPFSYSFQWLEIFYSKKDRDLSTSKCVFL